MSVQRLPINRHTGEPLPPSAQPGYYPGYSTLGQQDYWDEATRKLVLDRVHNPPPIAFFQGHEVQLMQAICDRLLPQDDRVLERRVPILNYIDDRLYRGVINGYRFEDMPSDGDAYKLALRGIDEVAQHMYQADFVELGPKEQDGVLFSLHDGDPPAGHETWKRVPVSRFWQMVVGDATDAYYAHPWAWDEVGFGGPAYPRAYMRLDMGRAEPWEVDEVRYDWTEPPTSLSGEYRQLDQARGQHPAPSQSGTH